MRTGLVNSDELEIVIAVTADNTIGFRIYPHYKGNYINLARARDEKGLMRKLLYLSDQNFLFWGADDTSDVFSGYTITLESGFPADAIVSFCEASETRIGLSAFFGRSSTVRARRK